MDINVGYTIFILLYIHISYVCLIMLDIYIIFTYLCYAIYFIV